MFFMPFCMPGMSIGLKQHTSHSHLVGYAKNAQIFTARCTLVQSAVLRSHVVRLSVRLSVCNVGGSGPYRLEILETNCMYN